MKGRRRTSQGEREDTLPDLSSSPAISPPPIEWEDHSVCLGPILRHNSLPLVVQCDRRGLPSIEHVNFDFSQPLLLHTRRTVRKVVASNVLHVPQNGVTCLKEVGDHLLIPEDYKGWFAVLGPPEDVKPERVIPHFRQVAQLALSKCESFLIGGNEPVSAVQLPPPGAGSEIRAQPRLVYPGDVLRMGQLYVGESTIKVKKPKLFGGKKMVKKEEKFLLCTDDKDQEVYLPVECRGTFYMLTTEGHGKPKIPIMRMPDICTHYRFPCVAKLLFGRVPTTPCSFTGTLMLQDSQLESSVIGCTMLNLRNILLDIPIDSDLRFFLARPTMDLLSSKCYKSAKALCQDKAATYMRNMKVAYYITGDEDNEPLSPREEAERERRLSESEPISSKPESSMSSVSNISRASALSRSRPSIVEEHEFFCPPENTPKSPEGSPEISVNKKTRRSIPNADSAESADSPTVLRKDKTYTLPEEREVLPLRSTRSTPSLSASANSNRPLPPLVSQQSQPIDTLPNGHYITMGETSDQPSGSQGMKATASGSQKAPALPPKGHRTRPFLHSSSDAGVYTQVWNGHTQVSPTVEEGGGLPASPRSRPSPPPSSSPSNSPVLRPKQLRVSGNVHRVSSIAFADTYLTMPIFRPPNTSGSTATTPSSVSGTTASNVSREAVYKTPSSTQGTVYKTPSSVPVSDASTPSSASTEQPNETTSATSSETKYESPKSSDYETMSAPLKLPHTTSDQQPYEVMSAVAKSSQDTSSQMSASQRKPPVPPPKIKQRSSHSQSSDGGVSKYKPLPPLPTPTADDDVPPIVFENPPWTLSDTSSLQSVEYTSRSLSRAREDSEDGYGRVRQTSFTYYEGCDSAGDNTKVKREYEGRDRAVDLMVRGETGSSAAADTVSEQSLSVAESEEILYENVQNLRLCKDKTAPSSDNASSQSTDGNHGRFLDKLANPPTMFGYVMPPVAQPLAAKIPPPVAKKPVLSQRGSQGENLNLKTSFESSSSSADPVLPPPKPCRPTDDGYLHPCPNPRVIPPLQQLERSRDSDICSRASSEDDLPLGATFANFRSPMSDSGCALESVADDAEERRSDVSSMSVADLGAALKNVGLMKHTVDTLQKEKVDGRLLVSLDEDELKEVLPDVKKLEIKKIRMFVNGWRPRE